MGNVFEMKSLGSFKRLLLDYILDFVWIAAQNNQCQHVAADHDFAQNKIYLRKRSEAECHLQNFLFLTSLFYEFLRYLHWAILHIF